MNRGAAGVYLEVCCDSEPSARAAASGGAHRVELCDRLDLGGTTPADNIVRRVRSAIAIELFVMIRPRGGDFVYTAGEIARMQEEIVMAKAAGADGVVFGILTAAGAVDEAATRHLAELARPMGVTFHRAFDEAADPMRALDAVVACGADRLLTSGQRPTAAEGVPLLAGLVGAAKGRLSVMPGAGIRIGNAGEIVRRTGARELHVGAGVRDASGSLVDADLVRDLLRSLRA